MKGKLILEDGTTFRGQLFGGSNATAEGEVVFNTGMTGYQEILTDPSYCRQIVTLTYPLIGNYGTAKVFNQSRRSFVGGLVIGELCDKPSSSSMEKTLLEYLTAEKIPCLYDVDTRALTKKIRSAGTMKGVLVSEYTSQATINDMMKLPIRKNVVEQVTAPVAYTLDAKYFGRDAQIELPRYRRSRENNCGRNSCAQSRRNFSVERSRRPKRRARSHQRSQKTYRHASHFRHLFGTSHRGCNQPVKNIETGKVYITSQNHGYAVEEKSLQGLPLKVTHVSLNDGTVEGVRHTELPITSVQYHPEAAPGPNDSVRLFDEFIDQMKAFRA